MAKFSGLLCHRMRKEVTEEVSGSNRQMWTGGYDAQGRDA